MELPSCSVTESPTKQQDGGMIALADALQCNFQLSPYDGGGVRRELVELQFKLDEMENRSQRSNLRFIEVPEEIEASSSVTRIVADLIYTFILPEKATSKEDLSIMRAQTSEACLISRDWEPPLALCN
ncbi:hypothetical protein NDU88_007107 [Pleurodeles waltl]|uniref:Uncharacterized protein n=1 Tax=Pleurodeles waltl TaxID=8319 RepID=A0AAV7PNB8_PLEWA|nr:hypothetical protein NDU88_007107 [Pleurodeles waltl]